MVELIVPGLYFLCGVTASVMLQIGSVTTLVPRRSIRLTFFGMCLCVIVGTLLNARFLQLIDAGAFVETLRWNLDAWFVFTLLLVWFVRAYTGDLGRRWPIAFSALFVVLLILNHVRPDTVQYARLVGVERLRMPWGEWISRGVGSHDAYGYLAAAATLAALAYASIQLSRMYRRTRRQVVLWLLLATLFLACSALEGILVRLFELRWFEGGPFGFMVMVGVMYLSLEIDAQRQLRAAASDFRSLFEQAPTAMVAIDPVNGRLVHANPTAVEMLGYGTGDLAELTLTELTVVEDRETAARQLDDLHAGRMSYQRHEHRFLRKDGRVVTTDCAMSTLPDANGRVERIIAGIVDITERKRMETALTESEMRLRAVIEQSPVAISLIRDGMTQEVNSRFLEMFGYASIDEVRGTSTLSRIAPSDRAAVQERLQHPSGDVSHAMAHEVTGLRKDGSELPLLVSGRRIELADGPVMVAYLVDFSERKAFERKIRRLAFYDQLTQLPNRRQLLDRLQQALASSVRNGCAGALLLIDLDNFKHVNDTLGHGLGDALLQQVAERLLAGATEAQIVARVGGDEFAVVLEDVDSEASAIVDRVESAGAHVMQALARAFDIDGREIHTSCSVGAATFGSRADTATDVVKQADIALDYAKQTGRSAVRLFDPQMQRRVSARVTLENQLRRAVREHQFRLHYQAQVEEHHGVVGAEALVRWEHPELGLVPPAQFIPLAEETRMILPIGAWVIESACSQLNVWGHDPRTRGLTLAVNVSPLQFQQPEFVDLIREAVRRHGVPPNRLKLELTETLLQGDVEHTIRTMEALREEGVRFALDDFGTGYSSLSYLKRLPLDQLKIDQSFVRDIVRDANDKVIVTTIMAMARSLNLDVIAEGVETVGQLEKLRELGCRSYQGYLFGRPMSAEQFVDAMAKVS